MRSADEALEAFSMRYGEDMAKKLLMRDEEAAKEYKEYASLLIQYMRKKDEEGRLEHDEVRLMDGAVVLAGELGVASDLFEGASDEVRASFYLWSGATLGEHDFYHTYYLMSGEAEKIYRKLGEKFLPDLAASLLNEGNALLSMSSEKRSLKAFDEAAKIYDGLEGDYKQNLALALIGEVDALISLNKPEEALKYYKKAEELYRDLFREDASYRAYLIDVLTKEGEAYRQIRRYEEAIRLLEEANELTG